MQLLIFSNFHLEREQELESKWSIFQLIFIITIGKLSQYLRQMSIDYKQTLARQEADQRRLRIVEKILVDATKDNLDKLITLNIEQSKLVSYMVKQLMLRNKIPNPIGKIKMKHISLKMVQDDADISFGDIEEALGIESIDHHNLSQDSYFNLEFDDFFKEDVKPKQKFLKGNITVNVPLKSKTMLQYSNIFNQEEVDLQKQ